MFPLHFWGTVGNIGKDIWNKAGDRIVDAGLDKVIAEDADPVNPPTGGGWGLTDWRWAKWVTLPPSQLTGVDALRAARKFSAERTPVNAVGLLKVPRTDEAGTKAYWAQRKGDDWTIPAQRLGVDRGAIDQNVSPADIVFDSVVTDDGGGTDLIPEGDMEDREDNMFGFRFGRTQPRLIQQRRCPPGMRLAKDGWCYPTKMLPKAARANQEKKAPVSWSDANHIRKGRSAQKRLNRFAKTGEAEARKTFGLVRRGSSRRRKADK